MSNGNFNTLLNIGTYLNTAATNRHLSRQSAALAQQLDAVQRARARQQQVEAQRQFVFDLRKQLEEVEELAATAPGEAFLFRLELEPMLGRVDESIFPEFRDKEYVHEVRKYARRVLDAFRGPLGEAAVEAGLAYQPTLDLHFRLKLLVGLEKATAVLASAGLFSKGKAKAEAVAVLRQYDTPEQNVAQFQKSGLGELQATVRQIRGMLRGYGYHSQLDGRPMEALSAEELDREIEAAEARIREILDALAAARVIPAGALQG